LGEGVTEKQVERKVKSKNRRGRSAGRKKKTNGKAVLIFWEWRGGGEKRRRDKANTATVPSLKRPRKLGSPEHDPVVS